MGTHHNINLIMNQAQIKAAAKAALAQSTAAFTLLSETLKANLENANDPSSNAMLTARPSGTGGGRTKSFQRQDVFDMLGIKDEGQDLKELFAIVTIDFENSVFEGTGVTVKNSDNKELIGKDLNQTIISINCLDENDDVLATFERTFWDSEALHLLALLQEMVVSKGKQTELRFYMGFQGNNKNAWVNTFLSLERDENTNRFSELLGGKEFLESEDKFEETLTEIVG